jgi:MFS family permease
VPSNQTNRRIAVSLEVARSQEPPRIFSLRAIHRHYACLVVMFCSISIGFNGTLLNSLLTNGDFRLFFNVQPTGARVGIMTATYQIGAILALPFLGLYLDRRGRRFGIFVGSALVCIGAIAQSIIVSSNPFAWFIGGRVLLGLGFATMTASAPIYIGEIAHPAQRGVVTAIYSTFWFEFS